MLYCFAKKIGNSHLFSENNIVNVTLLKVLPISLVRVKTKKKDGYNALILACGDESPKKIAKPQRVEFEKNGATLRRKIFEYRLPDDFDADGINISREEILSVLTDEVLETIVDVTGYTIGRGFTGAIKRWRFARQDASHGGSLCERKPGSTGQRQDPGRVFKGKKMPGHYGNERVTIKGLKVVYYNKEANVIGISGSVPGAKGGLISIKTSTRDFAYYGCDFNSLNGFVLVNN